MPNLRDLKFHKMKNIILFLYKFKCYKCKIEDKNLHCHHIDGNRHNNNAFNLMPLCKDCHKKIHKANIKIELRPEENTKDSLNDLNDFFN